MVRMNSSSTAAISVLCSAATLPRKYNAPYRTEFRYPRLDAPSLSDEPRHALGAGEISGNADCTRADLRADALNGLRHFLLGASVYDHLGALPGEPLGGGKANSCGRSRDQSPLAAEFQIHHCILV
jgi:hypothetical protein